ncbi:DNA helicase PIF1, ATP-dependent [Tanacetum coccineum]
MTNKSSVSKSTTKVVGKSESSQKAPLFLDQLEVDVIGTIVGNMIHCSEKSNVAHNFLRMKEGGIYVVKNFVVVPNKDEFRIFKQDLFMLDSSSTVIYDDDDIPCLQELKADSSFVEPTKAVLAVGSSLPKEGTLENLLIWARNRQNNLPSTVRYRLEVVVADDTAHTVVVMFNDTVTELIKCSAESLMVTDDEGADAYDDSNFPTTIRNLIGTTHVLEIKSHTYYEYGSFESFTCWKINPSESVEDAASSSTPTLTADEASPSFKSLAKHPTVKTPSKPNEEKKKRLEDSDEEEVSAPVDNKKKKKRYIEDDSESA